MRLAKSLVLFCLTIFPATRGLIVSAQSLTTAGARPSAEALAGSWRLVSVETIRSGGEIIYPFYGKSPKGLLIYDRSGWMSVQIVSDPQPTVPATSSRESFTQAPSTEKAVAIDGYYAYYGTWTLDAAASTVTHHIKQSLYPGERNTDVVRRLVLDGNRLTLLAKAHEMGEDHQRKLVWERIEPEQH
ncbi:MAG TPA: lipocalin-like domain-containing protein [Terracidiphilus sp.]